MLTYRLHSVCRPGLATGVTNMLSKHMFTYAFRAVRCIFADLPACGRTIHAALRAAKAPPGVAEALTLVRRVCTALRLAVASMSHSGRGLDTVLESARKDLRGNTHANVKLSADALAFLTDMLKDVRARCG